MNIKEAYDHAEIGESLIHESGNEFKKMYGFFDEDSPFGCVGMFSNGWEIKAI